MIKEKPILFCADMVCSITDGRKTQTRRIAKTDKPPYTAGDILYVRETWAQAPNGNYLYKADSILKEMQGADFSIKWKPSIHMPKVAARIFLEVTQVRKERLQDITEANAIAEGAESCSPFDLKQMPLSLITCLPNGNKVIKKTARIGFYKAWQEINRGTNDWDSNPYVWVVAFKIKDIKRKEARTHEIQGYGEGRIQDARSGCAGQSRGG